jgi:hypothetical protein
MKEYIEDLRAKHNLLILLSSIEIRAAVLPRVMIGRKIMVRNSAGEEYRRQDMLMGIWPKLDSGKKST